MLIFLDTNVTCSNYYMTGPSFEMAQKVGTIVFGKNVVDEVCNKYKENLEEQIAKANKALQELRKTLPELKITLEDINVRMNVISIGISWRCLFLKVAGLLQKLIRTKNTRL